MEEIRKLLLNNFDIFTSSEEEKKSGRGRTSSSAGSVYGIKKLRELILELAVRGKLVQQNPDDEPASELLKRIQAEKSKLIRDQKIKKQKSLPSIPDEEKPFELPNGWEWTRLDNISPMSIIDGDWIESKDQDPGGPIRLIQLADIGVGEFKDKSDRFINLDTFERLNCTELQIGDILIARLPSPIGRACIFPRLNQRAITVVDVAILRPLNMFCSEYLVDTINSKTFRDQVESFGKGATRFRVATGNLKNLLIPVPPMDEQRRIVSKICDLMALCDQLESQHNNASEAHEKLVNHLLDMLISSKNSDDFFETWKRISMSFDVLFTTEESIDALKKVILQFAVMGKLIPQRADDEPASELLKRIQAEKQKLISKGKIKKEKPFSSIADDEKPFFLSKGWSFVRLNELLSKIGAGSTPLGGKQVYVSHGIPFLRSQNVWDEGLCLEDVVFITLETHKKMSGTHVYPGDLLFNITGGSIGRCAIVSDDFKEGNVSQHVTIIRPVVKNILKFLHLVLISEYVQKTVMDVQVGVSREGLSIGKLGQFVIPIPPLAEQNRIVDKINELMKICDELKTHINSAKNYQKKMADSLLEQAI